MAQRMTASGRAPRRRRPSTLHRAVDGLMRVGLWVAAILCFGLFVNKVWHPYGLNRNLRQEMQGIQAQKNAVKDDNARLRRRIQYLQTPQGQAAEARRLGYHFPGEIPLRLHEAPAKPAPKPPAAAPAAP